MLFKTKSETKEQRIVNREILFLPIDSILPNPAQPRQSFEKEAIDTLADSIRRYGILQPLSVRIGSAGRYELIAGERRLRAAKQAGLSRVPCVLISAGERESAELAIIENLQRRDLDFFEEATAILALIREYQLTQEQIAERLSVSQSYVANKLRLLRFDGAQRQMILEGGLSERHARALLRLDEAARTGAIEHIRSHGLNVAATEEYVERRLVKKAEEPRPRARIRLGALRDLRLFYNSVDRAMGTMRRAGLFAACEKRETEDGVDLLIQIRKTQ